MHGGFTIHSKLGVFVAAIVGLAGSSEVTWGQIVIPPRPAGGVYVDPSGVVRSREVRPQSKSKRSGSSGKANGKQVEVSLRGLFESARNESETLKQFSNRVRYLEGLVEIHSLWLDEGAKDLILVGIGDDIETRPVEGPKGRETERPAITIEDFVVALRTAGPGRPMRPFGCSIDMDPNGLSRAQEAANKLIAKQNYNANEIVRAMEGAIGLQAVRVFGAPPNSPFAFACVEADVRLKRLALGLDPSPVKRVKSHLSMSRERGGAYTRWWFVPDYGPIGVSEDGNSFELSGPRLKLLASDSPTVISKPTASAQRFVELFNSHMEELCQEIEEFSRLRNLSDLAVIAALIASDRLDQKAELDLDWVMKEFPIPEVAVPESAEPLVNMVRKGSVVNVAAGGVQIDAGRVVRSENRKTESRGR